MGPVLILAWYSPHGSNGKDFRKEKEKNALHSPNLDHTLGRKCSLCHVLQIDKTGLEHVCLKGLELSCYSEVSKYSKRAAEEAHAGKPGCPQVFRSPFE